MKKTILYISALIISLNFALNIQTVFATTVEELNNTAEELATQVEEIQQLWEKQEKEREELLAKHKKELEEANKNKATEEEIKALKTLQNKEFKDLIEYQKTYMSTEVITGYKQSLIPKPSTLPGPTIAVSKQEREVVTTKILPRIASFVIGFAGVLALVSILFSGVKMMLSAGEEDVFTASKARIQWAILGLLVSILAFIAVQITININFEEKSSPTQTEENN
ncbi:MAG: hypothetical protein RBS56_02725 [Candidatus Gracilibacteria bacterium]|jgi:hypothetical protein|nr:hypothetical protein [Candidatus Gracilibacteria bacterium]